MANFPVMKTSVASPMHQPPADADQSTHRPCGLPAHLPCKRACLR